MPADDEEDKEDKKANITPHADKTAAAPAPKKPKESQLSSGAAQVPVVVEAEQAHLQGVDQGTRRRRHAVAAAAAVEPLSLNNFEQSRSAAARGARRCAAHSTLITR